MRNFSKVGVAISCLVGLTLSSAAMAKPHHYLHHYRGEVYAVDGRRPLLVERRSFLDPGPVVPVGTYTQYVYQPAYVWGDPVSTYQRSRYMDENLHQAFDPQPRSPLVLPLQFWP